MALVDSQEVSLAISAQTTGQAGVSELANTFDALARSGAEVAPEIARIAQEIQRLSQQKVSINGLEQAIAASKQTWQTVSQARHEVQVLDKALADARGAGASAAAIRLLEKELRSANGQLTSAEKAWTRQKSVLASARSEASALGVDVKNLAQAEQKVATDIAAATNALEAHAAAAARARQADQERAAALRAQAQEEDRLAAIVAASKAKMAQAAQQQLAAEKAAYAESQAAAKRYADETRAMAEGVNRAFGSIGIRSSKAIQAEIHGIQQALQRLAGDAKVSGAEFDRAWAAGQKRIAALKAEMSGGIDPFTASVGRATGGIGTFVSRLNPVAGAIAAAFSVDRIARMAVEFDSINRTLTAITGSSQAAAAELGYITAAAGRLGLDLGSASKAYAQFMAVTKGTSLEGAKARAVFESIAGAMQKLGKSSAETDGALLALSQMVSKGVVSMEELRQQLAERLPGAMKAAADGVGLTEAELVKMVSTGQVLAEDLLPALAGQLDKLYGTGEVDGYAASWNRLTSAVTNVVGAITQTSWVMDNVTVSMAAVREVVLVFGTGFTVAAEAVSLLRKTVSETIKAIVSGNWDALKGKIGTLAEEAIDRINRLAGQTLIAKGVQDALGDSVETAGKKAEQSALGWLGITAAYESVYAAAKNFVTESEKALKASQAESAAMVQFAQHAGSVVQQREAEAEAARMVAAAQQQLAQAKAAELATLQSELAAKEQVVAATKDESDNKKKLIGEIRQKIALSEQEAAQSAAAAQQAAIDAAARSAVAQATRDNSGALDALRAAYERAHEALRLVEEGERAGIATTEEVVAARARAAQATILYRDAVADTLQLIEAESRAKQAGMNVEERLGQLKLAQIRRAEQSARATDNEVAAAWRAVEAKREEARLAELKARAQQEEARAQRARIEAQEKELTAAERLDQVKIAELEAAKASASAKEIEGQISAELAKQLHAEADAAIRAMQAKAGTAETNGEVADSANAAAEGVTALNRAANAGGDIAAYFAAIWTEAKDRVREASEAAYNAINKIEALTDGPIENRALGQFAKGVDALRATANQFVAEDPIGMLEADITAAEAAAERAASTVESFGKTIQNASLTWKSFWEDTQAMYKLEESIYRARVEHIKLNVQVERFSQAVEEGSVSLRDQEKTLASLVRQAETLGSQNLSELRSALGDVRNQLRQVADDARAAKDSIADEIDTLLGRYEDVERRRFAARRADLESRRDEAKADGNAQAVADLNAALSKLAELERLQLEQARQREKEAAQRAQAPTTSSAAPAKGATSVYRVEIGAGAGRKATINTADKASADALVSVLQRLESDMLRS